MSSRLDKAIKDFIQIIREAGNKGTSPLDAQAEVLRIDEDGTAWVHLPGGVDETPVKLTINAEVGDKVYVRLSGGRAWITGNQTAPPTDDKTATVAKRLANIAGNQAKTAQKTADQAQIVANSALKDTKENAAQMAQMVIDFNGNIKNLQNQIDGNIATWFYDVDPDMGLPPVTDWDTDEKKDAHLGDIYYNTVKGYAWRFMKSESTYSWERITDTDVTKALADAAKAQDTADSKRRVFYNTPTVPYDAGDLWVQGSGGDILRCAQAKTSTGSYDRNDWVLASKYTDNSALNAWIEGDFAATIQGLEEGLVDAKVETYYQTTDPSTGWSDTQKSEHRGDLWYNSTASVQKYYRWSGTAWQELTATPPQAVFDSIDKKATIYTGTTIPTNPSSGDLWFKGADEPILTYVNNSWVEYNKYTDDSTLNAWLTNTYAVDKTNLQNQIDGKAETWYQATDPSLDWSAADKPNHEGDLWYNTSDNTTWYYTGSAWSQQSIPTSVFNNINGKANIFVGSTAPENPKTGDLWLESASSDILTYVDGSWVKYNKYTDDTKAEQAIENAANAQTSINNLEIGGRNLILNSETKEISKYKDTITTETGITVSEWGTKNAFRTYGTCSNSTTFGLLATGLSSPRSASGQAYVHSIYVKNNGGTAIYIANNGIGGSQIIQPGESKRAILYGTGNGVQYLLFDFSSSNLGDAFDVTYWRPKIEIGNKATDWTPAPEDVDAGIANAQATADEAQEYVLGVQTFEYILDGVTIPVHKREDGTYYYILNDAEVDVTEADLVHNADGDLVSYQEGGINESLNDITKDIDAIDTKVNGFDAREDAIYKSIQDNSLIARKNARVEENSIIITNDTTTEELLNYLQLDADAITIYGEGDQIVTIAKYGGNSGYMEMAGTSLLIAQESRLSTIRLRSADRIGNLAFVAGSDGHVSLREVLD